MDESTASPRHALASAIGSLWWVPLLRGVFLVILGVYALFRPGMTVSVLTQVVGVFLIADGVLAVIAGSVGDVPSRGWTIARGVVAVLIGGFVFANPALVAGVTAAFLLYLLAFAAIALGAIEIWAAVHDRREIEGEVWLLIGGALTVLFGILLLIAPIAFGLLVVRILGIFAIGSGISLIAFAFRLRRVGKRLSGA
ncbi:MAG: HdeD family acid-resistance protein [Planctomycetota bacterium]|nr:MAG: HdeD family acid-resistance protein [Planctomycetota bacterium]